METSGTSNPEHRMFVAFPSRKAARQYNLNRNHHIRVWCICMDHTKRDGSWGDSDYHTRVGNWDWLGVADVRIPGSALEIFHKHLEEVAANDRREYDLPVSTLPRSGDQ